MRAPDGNVSSLESPLQLPDLWQQAAIRHLQQRKDVLVSAPTGAGKTYIFEALIENGFEGRAVYTVPTRALANDKMLEWRRLGWEVGLITGDRTVHPEAPVIVATLETQKVRLLRGEGPDLLVIDEYQMLGDRQRGLNYELSIAGAPPDTQLLLLSGSVGNPDRVVQWLRSLSRKAELVHHRQRPVPLEEVAVEGLHERVPDSVRGPWPRAIAKVLKAGMAPLLIFAPRRRAAEDLAMEIARNLPEEDPLVLTPEQEKLAGDPLKRLLRARIAFHHSGLDYGQRAGLIEPLAKAGQLRTVVATMGLAAGINFSMRSVLVTDRSYRSGEQQHEVRPDELLQMFGRAGRRGMDKVGYIVVFGGSPRLQEARPLQLRRINQIDWPSVLAVMRNAIHVGRDPVAAARALAGRFFSVQRIPLGLADFKATGPAPAATPGRVHRQPVREFQDPDGEWHRRRAPRLLPLHQCWLFENGDWRPALLSPSTLKNLPVGTLCRLPDAEDRAYGRNLPVARYGRDDREGEMVLNRGLLRKLREQAKATDQSQRPPKRLLRRFGWTLEGLEREILPRLPGLCHGGAFHSWNSKGEILYARLSFGDAHARVFVDASQRGLLQPPERTVYHEADLALPERTENDSGARAGTAADLWYSLGLIDPHARPTRRGELFSFFNYGEGLAIAAALEDENYALEDLLCDIANIRAGHRFAELEEGSGRLAAACRIAYGMISLPGYLRRGLPETYGEGAAEVLFGKASQRNAVHRSNRELRRGDIERARLEWRSILRHIAASPDLEWPRWQALREAARVQASRFPRSPFPDNLPALTPRQQQRHKSFLRFDNAG